MKSVILILCIAIIKTCSYCQDTNSLLIAAASDMKYALDSAIAVFKNAHPKSRIDVTYGSSGKLFEQISHSAPFDLYFSADIEYPLNLKKKGVAISDVQRYGIGRLVVWSGVADPNTSGIHLLTDKSIFKIAIANPAHAPYGRRAIEVLKHYKIYESVKNKLVYGENISQAAQFVTAGAAEAGIIALSLALSPSMKKASGSYYLIPQEAHKALDQGFVILKHAEKNRLASAFKEFMLSNEASDILAYFGFSKK